MFFLFNELYSLPNKLITYCLSYNTELKSYKLGRLSTILHFIKWSIPFVVKRLLLTKSQKVVRPKMKRTKIGFILRPIFIKFSEILKIWFRSKKLLTRGCLLPAWAVADLKIDLWLKRRLESDHHRHHLLFVALYDFKRCPKLT